MRVVKNCERGYKGFEDVCRLMRWVCDVKDGDYERELGGGVRGVWG